MSLRRPVLIAVMNAMLLCAQNDSTPSAAPMIFPPPAQSFTEVKQYLNLSDAQVEQLRAILQQKDRVTQEVWQQIAQKQRDLNVLLESGSNDATRIGQLLLEIRALEKKQPLPTEQYRAQALALLTPEQRTLLGTLDQAMKLSTTAHQAVQLSLIDPPPPSPPVILATEPPR